MVVTEFDPAFEKTFRKLKDDLFKERVRIHIRKILANPEIGKPMLYERKGTREVYISPYRLAYAYLMAEQKIIFLDLYHKDEQ